MPQSLQLQQAGRGEGSQGFKVIGYLRLDDLNNDSFSFLDSGYVTQVNIAFINPDEQGVMPEIPYLKSFIKKAHDKGVLVFASIGGGHRHPYFDRLLNQSNRNRICDAYIKLMKAYELDGIDVDIENEDITEDYAPFVLLLGAKVHLMRKQISSALSYSTRRKIADKVLQVYDFVNLMAYDRTGPWNPDNPGQHAPYDMCVTQLNYWEEERGVGPDKVVLGLPFYGYGFGKDTAFSMSYKQILHSYPWAADTANQIKLPQGINIYYNGRDLIIKKVLLAKKKAGGVMIWHLKQDAEGANSLLRSIHDVLL